MRGIGKQHQQQTYKASYCLCEFLNNKKWRKKEMNNQQIKDLMKQNNIFMWQVAKKLGVYETSFSKWFREELSEERKQQVLSAIEEIKLDRLKVKK